MARRFGIEQQYRSILGAYEGSNLPSACVKLYDLFSESRQLSRKRESYLISLDIDVFRNFLKFASRD